MFALSGCVSGGLKNDYKPAALDTGFHSADIIVNGQHNLGVAAAQADPGQPFYFRVGGIGNGFVRVTSEVCKFDQSKTYTKSQDVWFKVQPFGVRCLYRIFVQPQFTEDQAGKREWRGLSGVLLLRRTKAPTILRAVQVESRKVFPLVIPAERGSKVFLKGCSFSGESITASADLELDVDDFFSDDICVIDGFVKQKDEVKAIAILVSRYEGTFMPLPEPEIKLTSTKIRVNADSSVSLLAFLSQEKFESSAEFKMEPGTLKGYTVKGRAFYCMVSEGVYKCLH